MPSDTRALVATCAPDFTDPALAELHACTDVDAATLAPGVLTVDAGMPFGALARALRRRPPVFVRHIQPVHAVVSLAGDEADVERLVRAASHLPLTDAQPCAVQVRALTLLHGYRPHDAATAIADACFAARGLDVSVSSPRQVVSALIGDREARLGVSDVYDNLSSWPGGMRRFARDEGRVSRAEFKLLEAIEAFGIDLSNATLALDLGAAPGGWTRVLRSCGLDVVAVDPGELDPRITGVRHLRTTTQSLGPKLVPRADVLANDMRIDARRSARETVRLRPLLASVGIGLVTLKLPHRGAVSLMEEAVSILSGAYKVRRVKQLFHNRHEVTAYFTW